MKKIFLFLSVLFLMSGNSFAQQVTNAGFEDWSGAEFDGNIQPANWNASNVTQIGFKFNFAHQAAGHTGNYSMMVQDQEVGAAGITETSPGYFSLGTPWVYIESLLKVSEATAGDYGGIAWTWRPDTLAVWIRRTGDNALKEDYHLLYYSWKGTATGNQYKGKNENCTSTTKTDEESDIRQFTDGNECGTAVKATQIAEGWLYEKAVYNDWTLIKVPILYCSDEAPEKMNMIFSASNYPNFRANSGLYEGNSLYVDDVQLIYSSKIQHLYIDGKEWRGFDPYSTEEQLYSLGESETQIPNIQAMRGEGSYTNSKGEVATFVGRRLQSSEMTITPGQIDGTPTLITVQSEDGGSTTTYKIKFVHAASTNAALASITINGQTLPTFRSTQMDYMVELPYGTTQIPIITALGQEDAQTIVVTQPTSLTGTATITVTAADQTTQMVYTLHFRVAALADNTLQDILVNGQSLPGFNPTQTTYRVSLPIGTTQMPTIQAVSAYPEGEQTITYTAPSQIEGGTYQIAVSTPGNPTPKTYKLNFKLEASSYTYLRDLQVEGGYISHFDPEQLTYYVTLPMGTTSLPAITYTPGDSYQTVTIVTAGIDGTTRVTVTAGNGVDKLVYKIVFTTPKSEISTLNGILLNGEMISGFRSDSTWYEVQLPVGTTTLPTITIDKGDEYQSVDIVSAGLNGKTRITVTAGDESVTIYQIAFSVARATNTTLNIIYLDGDSLVDFDPETTTYEVVLPQGVQTIPTVTYTQHDDYQSVTSRVSNNTCILSVRAQDGQQRIYTLHFTVYASSNTHLNMIYLDGDSLPDFDANTSAYTYLLPMGSSTIPNVTYSKQEASQRVITTYDHLVQTIQVTAENGDTQIYTITFVAQKSQNAKLNMIYLDGDSLPDFDADNLYYSIVLSSATCPVISVDRGPAQQVTITMPYAAGTAYILVTPEEGASNRYEIELMDTTTTHKPDTIQPYTPSSRCTLASILADGAMISGFMPQQHDYRYVLPAGSSIPTLTWVSGDSLQTIISGQVAENTYAALVTAENGDTSRYQVAYTILPYTDATLADLQVEGVALNFHPQQTDYTIQLERMDTLPSCTYQSRSGQTVLMSQVSDTLLQVMVTAQNGNTQTYRVHYHVLPSSNAYLSDLQVNGITIANWDAQRLDYVDSLAWRTKVVPVVTAIGQVASQTITTYYSAINGITRIDVQAEDGTINTYTIAFPVCQSSNTHLQDVYLDTDAALAFVFQPQVTDYTIELPYQTAMAPRLIYEKQESEQQVRYISRPIGQTTQLQVTAEDGSIGTYSFHFTVASSPQPNLLTDIYLPDYDIHLDLSNAQQREFSINLPYGSRSLNVTYTKAYTEQSVMIQPGGVKHPTYITVYPNRGLEAPTMYTIIPRLATMNPAVFTNLTVNGQTITDFNPERFAYLVPVQNTCIVRPTAMQDAHYIVTIQNDKHWQAEVYSGDYTNTYDIWFYYADDVVPNTDFEQWENAAYNGTKPVGWNTLGQFTAGATISPWGTYTTGNEVTQSSEGVVKMISEYNAFPLGGYVPGYITLGTISASFSVAAGSDFGVSGGMTFRNTPDTLLVNYQSTKLSNDASRIVYTLNGSLGSQTQVHTTTSTMSDFQTISMDLTSINAAIGIPRSMNIILNSFESEQGRNGLEASSAEMYVDWIRLVYNHHLQSVWVDGVEAQKSENTFTVTLSEPNDQLPTVRCVGETQDQIASVGWQPTTYADGYEYLHATITNYGEDGLSQDYTLTVKRPLYTTNTLQSLLVNGVDIPSWNPAIKDYTYTLSRTQQMPDVYPIAVSHLQTISTTYADSLYTITVTPQYGETSVYTLRLLTQLSSNTSLAYIADDGQQLTSFTKSEDGQTVELSTTTTSESILSSIVVTAEDGTVGHYTKQYVFPVVPTSGLLSEITLDGNQPSDFAPTTYEYTLAQPTTTAFVRQDAQDSVVYTQTAQGASWQVYGSQQHTYTLHYTQPNQHNTYLESIDVNGAPLAGFSSAVHEYTYATSSPVTIEVKKSCPSQQLTITHIENVYTIGVTAPDGTQGTPYTLTISPRIDTQATLDSLLINGKMLASFHPDTLHYTWVLEAGVVKKHQPILPPISYVPTSSQSSVEVLAGGLDYTTYINVSSADGQSYRQYELLITAEPSHCATLSSIMVDGEVVPNFESGRHYYTITSSQDNHVITWRSEDSFVTVSLDTLSSNSYRLHVVAEDGVTTEDYQLEIIHQSKSDNATLKMIWLDGVALASFSSMQNKYSVTLPQGTTQLPDIAVGMYIDGQSVSITRDGQTAWVLVTAPDGVTTNTYTLEFTILASKNTDLSMIYMDGDSLPGFDPKVQFYAINLPINQSSLPQIVVQKAQNEQQTKITTTASTATITVTAEDTAYTYNYILSFQFTLSSVDTLHALYEDEYILPEFDAHTYFYARTLPVGTTQFPMLSWETADAYQQVRVDTLIQTSTACTYQVVVTAQNGQKNIYTVQYTIALSDVDTLQMIYVNNLPLSSFSAYQTEYAITLPSTTTQVPVIAYSEGDDYQTITIHQLSDEAYTAKSLGQKVEICVTAQNGQQRIYTLHFPYALSQNTQLSNILLDGESLANFDETVTDYVITLPYGTTHVPVVTVTKYESCQNVDIHFTDSATMIIVTAEDATYTRTYTLTWEYRLSDDASLSQILTNGISLSGFVPTQNEYTITLPYGEPIPALTYAPSVEGQTITMDSTLAVVEGERRMTYLISVTSPSGEYTSEYTVQFICLRSDNAALSSLMVYGVEVSVASGFDHAFHCDSLIYSMVYPVGTSTHAFFTSDDVMYITQDSNATVSVSTLEGTVYQIRVTVTAHNGMDTRTYILRQWVTLSDEGRIATVYMDNQIYEPFDADVHTYTYYLYEGTSVPLITFDLMDTTATAYPVTPGVVDSIPWTLIGEAQDGTTQKYEIYFRYADINTAAQASEYDVLVQPIPGTLEVAAATLRENVSVAFYTRNGVCIEQRDLPVADYNHVITQTTSTGRTQMMCLTSMENTERIELKANEPYFYTFFYNHKSVISSGKIMLRR